MKRILSVIFMLIIIALPLAAAEYIVSHGDTLLGIARSQLGDSKRWPEIAELNGLKEPYTLRIGQRLKLPEKKQTAVPIKEPEPVVPLKEIKELPDVPEATPEGTPAVFSVPAATWLWMLICLLAYWWFSSISLYGGCWFSLVETSFMRCLLLSLVLAVFFEIIVLINLGVSVLLIRQKINTGFYLVPVIMSFVAFPVISIILIKRVLECKWRSVLTTLIMAQIVAVFFVIGLYAILFLLLPRIMGTEALKEFFNALMNSI